MVFYPAVVDALVRFGKALKALTRAGAGIYVYEMMCLESMEGGSVTTGVYCLDFGAMVVSVKELCGPLTALYTNIPLLLILFESTKQFKSTKKSHASDASHTTTRTLPPEKRW